MKKILDIYKPYMKKTIIYKIITRIILGMVLLFIFNRYYNAGKNLLETGNRVFVLGFLFLAVSWFNYLKIEGVKIKPAKNTNKMNKPANDYTKTITEKEFQIINDNELYSMDTNGELSDNEEDTTRMVANILSGVFFIGLSIILIII